MSSGAISRQATQRVVAVIPARYQSMRFPGKMLARETGRPLIAHVYERASCARSIHEVVIATDDDRIAAAAAACGARCVMTRADHPNGTSRIAEAVASLEGDIVVNVQGDEPELEPTLIDSAVSALIADNGASVSTVASPFGPTEDPTNPNLVKCVSGTIDGHLRALWFSRSVIPLDRDGQGERAPAKPMRHIGIYVYRREFLSTFVKLPATPLERTEQLEQLRILENGHAIALAIGNSSAQGIDTPEQYAAFVARWRSANPH